MRQDPEDVINRKAFRLCICADDRDLLLDSDKWPAFVSVYEWFFKGRQQPANIQTTNVPSHSSDGTIKMSLTSSNQNSAIQSASPRRLSVASASSSNRAVHVTTNIVEHLSPTNQLTVANDELIDDMQMDLDSTIVVNDETKTD